MKVFSLLICLTTLLIQLLACSSTQPTYSLQETEAVTSKKVTLNDAWDILNISLLLPSGFENLDAASEGLSHEDMGLEPECSEVYVFFSEDQPYQLIYHFIAIIESRIEAASFDASLDDEAAMELMLIEAIKSGATEEGIDFKLPSISISHPNIGDKALFGTGIIESYGFVYGIDTLWFRINHVYYFGYSLNWSEDKISLESIAKEIEERVNDYSQ